MSLHSVIFIIKSGPINPLYDQSFLFVAINSISIRFSITYLISAHSLPPSFCSSSHLISIGEFSDSQQFVKNLRRYDSSKVTTTITRQQITSQHNTEGRPTAIQKPSASVNHQQQDNKSRPLFFPKCVRPLKGGGGIKILFFWFSLITFRIDTPQVIFLNSQVFVCLKKPPLLPENRKLNGRCPVVVHCPRRVLFFCILLLLLKSLHTLPLFLLSIRIMFRFVLLRGENCCGTLEFAASNKQMRNIIIIRIRVK